MRRPPFLPTVEAGGFLETKTVKVHRLVMTAMLAAVAFLLMAAIQIPILPYAPFLTYDPSDAVGLLAGILYGPASGVTVVVLKDGLYLLLRAHGPFGPIADLIAAATFVAVTAWAFRRTNWHTPRARPGPAAPGEFARRLVEAAVLGAAARIAVMIPANFVLLALQFGMPPARVARMLVPAIIPFNAVKALANAAVALAFLEPFLRVSRPRAPSR